MERRVTTLLFALTLGLVAWMFFRESPKPPNSPSNSQAASQADGAQKPTPSAGPAATMTQLEPAERRVFDKDFGKVGEAGAMRITFDNHGAGIARVLLKDQFTRPGLSDEQKQRPENWYPVVQPFHDPSPSAPAGILTFEMTDLKKRFGGLPLEQCKWQVQEQTDGVTFRLDASNGVSVEKEFRHRPGERHLDVSLRLIKREGAEQGDWLFRVFGPVALPNPPIDQSFGNPSRVIAETFDGKAARHFSDGADGSANAEDPKDLARTEAPSLIRFVATVNRFFTAVMAPSTPKDAMLLALAEVEKMPYTARPDVPAFSTAVPLLTFTLKVPEQAGATPPQSSLDLRLYLGPKDNRIWQDHPVYRDFVGIRDVDLEPTCFCTIPGAVTLGKLLLFLMNLIHGVVPSWGLAILIMTVLVRSCLVPLNYKQQKSMRAYQDKMTRLKPQLDAMKEKFKNNAQKLNQEMMKFNKQHKLFPPLMGCLPVFVTMPVFIGWFTALRIAFELRHESFLLLRDLSQPDHLIPLGYAIPYLNPHAQGINVLPFVMIGMWLLLQRGMPKPTDPQQQQMMSMMKWMPIIIGFTFYSYASALMVYMICSSLFGMLEQKVLKARLGRLAPGAMQAF